MLEKTGGVWVAEFVMELGKEMQVYKERKKERNYICLGVFILGVLVWTGVFDPAQVFPDLFSVA